MIYSWMNKCHPMSSFWMFIECHCDILRGGCLPNSESDVESLIDLRFPAVVNFIVIYWVYRLQQQYTVSPYIITKYQCLNVKTWSLKVTCHSDTKSIKVMSEYEFIPGHSCWNSEVVVGSVLHRWVVSWNQYISRLSFNELLFAWILFVEFKDRLLYFRKC
jgi:hypothetical protein